MPISTRDSTLTIPVSYSYTEGFETNLGDWVASVSTGTGWTRNSGGTPSGGTGPSSAYAGSYYCYCETTDMNYAANATLTLNKELPSGVEKTISYRLYKYGLADLQKFAVQGWNGSSWVDIYSETKTISNNNTWELKSHTIGTTYTQVRFYVLTDNEYNPYRGDIAIDAVTVSYSYNKSQDWWDADEAFVCTNDGEKFDYVSSQSASDLGWSVQWNGVAGESDGPVACSGLKTFEDALDYAHSIGARLLTREEALNGVAWGTGCGYDSELIWTCDKEDDDSQHYVIEGRDAADNGTLKDNTETAYVRFAADEDLDRTDPVVIENDDVMKTWLNANGHTVTTSPTSLWKYVLEGYGKHSGVWKLATGPGLTGVTINDTGSGVSHPTSYDLYSINSKGADIWESSDGFVFYYLAMVLPTNFALSCRVRSTDGTNAWQKGGVMVRAALTGGARNAFAAHTYSNGAILQYRTSTNGSTTNEQTTGSQYHIDSSNFVRLRYQSGGWYNDFSTDGVNWTNLNWNGRPDFGTVNTMYVGIAFTSHDTSTAATCVFSDWKFETL